MATATAKKSAAKKPAKKSPAKSPATNGHTVLSDTDLMTLKENLLADPDARGAFNDELDLQSVVEKLIARRNELGMTATDVAKKIGASQPTMSQFEHGKISHSLSMCQRYARAVGMRLEIRLV